MGEALGRGGQSELETISQKPQLPLPSSPGPPRPLAARPARIPHLDRGLPGASSTQEGQRLDRRELQWPGPSAPSGGRRLLLVTVCCLWGSRQAPAPTVGDQGHTVGAEQCGGSNTKQVNFRAQLSVSSPGSKSRQGIGRGGSSGRPTSPGDLARCRRETSMAVRSSEKYSQPPERAL